MTLPPEVEKAIDDIIAGWSLGDRCAARLAIRTALADPVIVAHIMAGAWMPIESAPKDGTLILLCRTGTQEFRSCGEWTDHHGGYWTTDFAESVSPESLMSGQPTHWQLLPPLPAQEK